MTEDDEVEFNCHLLNGIDPLTALAALPRDDQKRPDPRRRSSAALAMLAVLLGFIVWLLCH
jgi:hypothetical protein